MKKKKDSQPSTKLILNQGHTVRYNMNLSIRASIVANLFFFSFLLICTLFSRETFSDFDDFEKAVELVFLALVFLVGFIGALPPGIIGGKITAMLLNTLMNHRDLPVSLGVLIGIFIGGLLGYLWLYLLGSLSSFSEFARDPVCGLLNGTIAGIFGGAWYGWRVTEWLHSFKAAK